MKDNTKIYYEERGEGETVLFLHGLSSSHFELRRGELANNDSPDDPGNVSDSERIYACNDVNVS